MIKGETTLRVRYGETDRMNYVYYGNYALYYEVARSELLRTYGISYKQIEDKGIMMPVIDLHVNFLKPAIYDDLLTIITTIRKAPSVKMKFEYEIFNSNKELINTGYTTLVFMNSSNKKIIRSPQFFTNLFRKNFN